MNAVGLFPAPAQWLAGAHLARVASVEDPEKLGRVQVQLVAADPEGTALIWARVAVPFAGDNFGAYLIPDVGAEVLLIFPAGESSHPIVIGALWNGATEVPETLPGSSVDRWTLTGRNGTRIAIIEQSSGTETVEISTPAGAVLTLTDGQQGSIALEVGSNSLVMDSEGISIETGRTLKLKGSSIEMEAPTFDVKTPLATFSAALDCKAFTATTVTSPTYSPGAGNVW